MKIYMARQKGKCNECWERTKILLNKIIPHYKDVKSIGGQYDKSIEGYFLFFRFLVATSIAVFLLYLGLLCKHIFEYDYTYSEI